MDVAPLVLRWRVRSVVVTTPTGASVTWVFIVYLDLPQPSSHGYTLYRRNPRESARKVSFSSNFYFSLYLALSIYLIRYFSIYLSPPPFLLCIL